MIRVGVIGAGGRMGSETCRAVEHDPELELVARVGRGDSLSALSDAGAEVAVDFTTPGSVRDNIMFCIAAGIHAVVGTTGLLEDQLAEIDGAARASGVGVIVAPNFATGAVLMMAFATRAAAHFDSAEIVERHHERKLDAPSGTALRTATMMNQERNRPWSRPSGEAESPAGSRGADVDGIRLHSVRVPGSVAHQEVILGSAGQTLTIRHDAVDRACFMPGVLLAIKQVCDRPGLTLGLEALLDL